MEENYPMIQNFQENSAEATSHHWPNETKYANLSTRFQFFQFDKNYYADMRNKIVARMWKADSFHVQQYWHNYVFANEVWSFLFLLQTLITLDAIIYLPIVLCTPRLFWIYSFISYASTQLFRAIEQSINLVMPGKMMQVKKQLQHSYDQAVRLLTQCPGKILPVAPKKIRGFLDLNNQNSQLLDVTLKTLIRASAFDQIIGNDMITSSVATVIESLLLQLRNLFAHGVRDFLLFPLYLRTAFSLTPLSATLWLQIIMMCLFARACVLFKNKLMQQLECLWWHTDRCRVKFCEYVKNDDKEVLMYRPQEIVLEETWLQEQDVIASILPRDLVSLVAFYSSKPLLINEILEIPDAARAVRIFEVTTCGKVFTHLVPYNDPIRQYNIKKFADKPYYYALAWTSTES